MAAPRNENIKIYILDATKELLKKRSFSEISLAEIAKAAGISKGTLYYHYKNKSEIFFDLTDQYLNEQWNDFVVWTEDKDKDTSINRLVKYVIERNIASYGLRTHLICEAQTGDEEVRQKLIKRYDDFKKLISEKISERTDIPPNFLTWMILLISDGIIVQEALQNENFDVDKFVLHFSEFFKAISEMK